MAIGFRTTLAAAALAALAALAGPSPAGPAEPADREPPPGMGVLCAAALFTATAEIGRRCDVSADPGLQAELEASEARLDAYILANSSWDRARLDRFKREQASLGQPAAKLCNADALGIHGAFARTGPGELKRWSERLVARLGPPRWGDCL